MVTGANSGIGKATALELARMGAYVIMVCRNEEKANRAKKDIIDQTGHTGIEIIIADLGIQYDVRSAADQFLQKYDALDVLINNAGMIPAKRKETADGIEKTLAVNHLGPFLLTNLLMEALLKASSGRVINVSSEVHRLGATVFDIDNLQLRTDYSPMKAYGLSKLCNIMFAHQLAQRTGSSQITANALHPGVVGTDLANEASWYMRFIYSFGKPFMKSSSSGAQTPLYLATSDEVNQISGQYFKNKKLAKPAKIAFDERITEQLWEKSERLTGLV